MESWDRVIELICVCGTDKEKTLWKEISDDIIKGYNEYINEHIEEIKQCKDGSDKYIENYMQEIKLYIQDKYYVLSLLWDFDKININN